MTISRDIGRIPAAVSKMSHSIWRYGAKAILMICSVMGFVMAAVLPMTTTTVGVQCPTAPIQTISVPIHDCCGKTVGYTQRKPQLGEKGFMQCQCAEKRTSDQKSQAPKKAELIIENHTTALIFEPITGTEPLPSYRFQLASIEFAPLVPPPLSA